MTIDDDQNKSDHAVAQDQVEAASVQERVELSGEQKARQRKRSIAIAVSLALFALLFYVITLMKMGGGVAEKAGS